MRSNTVIGFIGGGNMAKAIVEGILKKGLVTNSQIIVSATSEATLENWKPLGVNCTNSNTEVIMKADIIVLAVKPHQLKCVTDDIGNNCTVRPPSKLFVSILAGVLCDTMFNKLSRCVSQDLRFIRVMPNTLVRVGEGCSAVVAHRSATKEDVEIVCEIFQSIGKCEVVPEYQIHGVTGLSGSGPAYVYAIIEALSDGGVKQGLPRNLATTFAAQTVLGAAKMVLETNKHPGELKDEVCSAGGTTIHGLHALEKGGLRSTLMSAVEAAAARGAEISREMADQ